MANLYGTVKGRRGEASRLGDDSLRTTANTWHAGVEVWLDKRGGCSIVIDGGSGYTGRSIRLLDDNIEAIQQKLARGEITGMHVVYDYPDVPPPPSPNVVEIEEETE